LTPSFFESEDSSSDDELDCEKFKFNQEHSLYVFNAIKDHQKGPQSTRSIQSGRPTYEQKSEFMRHLDLIDLRLDAI